MLFINWRRHYDVPNLIYYSNIFKRDRKAKFYYLSDLVFKLIHRYCFRRVLAYYLHYLFKKRWLDSCENLTTLVVSSNKYSNSVSLVKNYRSKIYKTSIHFIKNVLKYQWRYIYNMYILKNGFKPVTYYLISKIDLLIKVIRKQYIYNRVETFYIVSRVKERIKISKNVLFLFLLWEDLKGIILKKNMFILNKSRLVKKSWGVIISKLLNYIKSKELSESHKRIILFNINRMNTKLSTYYLKHNTLNNTLMDSYNKKISVDYFYFSELYPNKNRNKYKLDTNLTTYQITFSLISKQIHTALYYLVLCSRSSVLQSNTVLNYHAFEDLKYKKSVFFTLKESLERFMNGYEDLLSLHRKWFYKYLNILLDKKQWLVGPTNKINLFRYVTHLSFKIKDYFKLAHYRNIYEKKNKLSFFYNTLKIRKELLYKLGKRRYREEFILLNNSKWWINYTLKYYYDINKKELLNYYNIIKKKYNITVVKDLFSFLEYKIPVFLNKYVSYTFTNISSVYLNNNLLNTNLNSYFYIGDYIKIELNSSYYDKFLILFNFIYFINPIMFKLKQQMLLDIYKKVFNFFNNYISKNIINFEINIGSINTKPMWYRYIYSLVNTEMCYSILKYKLFIKSVLYIVNKNKIEDSFKIHKTDITIDNDLTVSDSLNNFLLMYSFSKTIIEYKLTEFKPFYFNSGKIKRLPTIKFNRRFNSRRGSNRRRRRVFTFKNIYNWLYSKYNSKKQKRVFVSKFFNSKVHDDYYNRKINLFGTRKKVRNIIYTPNF